ncbi:MAG: endolytic transglycosylase MltG [Oscillospiraceae bacterium]|nr:endolytic transglycosylase MltG [Oscillospiraceae bacterium]
MNENGNSGFDMMELPLDRPKTGMEPEVETAAEEKDAIFAPAAELAADAALQEMSSEAELQEEETAEAEGGTEETAAEAAEAEEAAEEAAASVQEEEPVIEKEHAPAEEQEKKPAEKKAKPADKTKKPAAKKPAAKKTAVSGKKPSHKKQQVSEAEAEERWRMPGFIKFLIWLAFTLAAGLLLAHFAWVCAGDVFALSKPDREVEITITNETTLDDVIETLVEEGLVDYEWLFRLYCALADAENRISVGTFTLNNVYDYNALLKGMQAYSGTRETTDVTIPEGYTCKQIFAELEAAGVCSAESLETAAASYMFDYEFLQALPYGNANRLEGYLFPDTYEFYIDDTPERVLSKFLDNFSWKFEEDLRAEIAELNTRMAEQMRENGISEEKIAESTLDMHDVVIVASLIERETGGASESSLIASVIYNRLSSERYPLLEIDASVRYGLDKWEGVLSSADLAKDTPYNTRRNPGLPAGPISNPGLDSIRAALFPRNTEYYFYVLTPDGFHHFSETYYEHQDYIEEMQRIGN